MIPRILHYPGSKWSIAEWIISHMPEHETYLEPFFGSGAVFFVKQPARLETINDLDGSVVNLFRMIRENPEQLANLVKWTPYARDEYDDAHHHVSDEVEQARRFLVRCWQSIRVKVGTKSGFKCRGTDDEVHHTRQWDEIPDRIFKVAERLKRVQIENRPAIELIKRFNRCDVLIYADPPYVFSTRGGKMYEHEMADNDHIDLLEALDAHKGPVLLSGYENSIYDERLRNWTKRTTSGKPVNYESRTEVLWINPIAAASRKQIDLFEWEG